MPNYIVHLRNQEQFEACCSQLQSSKSTFKPFSKLRAVRITIDEGQQLNDVLNPEWIQTVHEDITVHLIQDQETDGEPAAEDKRWGMDRIGATYAHIPQKYARPRVAVIDTGLSLHPALNVSKKLYGHFADERSPQDQNGHGTHIGGVIAAKRRQGFWGMYTGLPLFSVKAFTQSGSAPLSSIIEALEWCMQHNIKIVNMSFGIQQHHPSLHEMIQAAANEGTILIAASGNDGVPGLQYPARYPEVIAVGSINQDNQVSSFSQFGTNLDVVAPGENIYSLWKNKGYKTISGTSMASAHVTGAIALMYALNPNLSVDETRQIITANTERLTTSSLLQGNGLISVKNIVDQLR